MEESNKLPLKRVELSLTKFNEVAIPHHLDLLRQHKVNIVKYEAEGAYARVRAEQTHARRVAQQLRALLGELDALRRRVRCDDLPRFDRLTQRSRDHTLRAVQDYLGVIESSCRALVFSSELRRSATAPATAADAVPGPARAHLAPTPEPGPEPEPDPEPVVGSVVSSESVGVLPDLELHTLQLQVDDHEAALRERELVLRGWGELAGEVRALHDAWQHVQAAALHQRELVAGASERVHRAADDVHAARTHLSAAERLRTGVWMAGGAVAGALAGGPVGLAVGAKAGAAAALAGSLLGCLGVRLLGRRLPPAGDPPGDPPAAAGDRRKED